MLWEQDVGGSNPLAPTIIMKVKIYKPSNTPTQSGVSKFKHWIVEFPKENNLGLEPLMGWQKSDNTHKQVQLKFDTLEQAIDYVKKIN